MEALFFCWPLVVRASLARGWGEEWVTSPFSARLVPLPPWALFLFLSMVSTKDARIGAGMGGRGITPTIEEEPLVWAISKARRSGVFSPNPIPSRILALFWLVLSWTGHRVRLEVLGAFSRSSY